MSSISNTQIIVESKKSIFIDKLSTDIRFIIYDVLIAKEHEIEYCTWSQYLSNPGILGPLSETCRKTRQEIEEWYKKKANSGLERSEIFGIFDPQTTVFWKRMFPFDVRSVDCPFSEETWDVTPVDSTTLAPFGMRQDIRNVPNEGEGPGLSSSKLIVIHARHNWHWSLLSKGHRPKFHESMPREYKHLEREK